MQARLKKQKEISANKISSEFQYLYNNRKLKLLNKYFNG